MTWWQRLGWYRDEMLVEVGCTLFFLLGAVAIISVLVWIARSMR